ncbi:hypothetical protein GGR52DRAFT_89298 [Hypoxylon sp. FL1284]|nr:hypothetical protein GGR52DRAFT_89298 [Hypoxylon sp. FL1284]
MSNDYAFFSSLRPGKNSSGRRFLFCVSYFSCFIFRSGLDAFAKAGIGGQLLDILVFLHWAVYYPVFFTSIFYLSAFVSYTTHRLYVRLPKPRFYVCLHIFICFYNTLYHIYPLLWATFWSKYTCTSERQRKRRQIGENEKKKKLDRHGGVMTILTRSSSISTSQNPSCLVSPRITLPYKWANCAGR